MMDGKVVRQKLIGSSEERAVSPVIGVILMVAITVILAAVIAAFVLDMSPGSEPVNAAIDVEVDNANGEIDVTVRSVGNAESFEVRGSNSGDVSGDLSSLSEAGDSATLTFTTGSTDGEINIVAIKGEDSSIVGDAQFQFS